MKLGLVLGAGGLVGMGYHAGALKALDDVGVDPHAYDVIIGTSAGAVIASYLAAGWDAADFYEYAYGRHPDAEKTPEGQRDEVERLFTPMWHSPAERARRAVGSAFAMASSRGVWRRAARGMVPHSLVRRAFPSGMYSTAVTRERLHRDLPQEWPRENVFLCTADLYTGKRVAFGTDGAPPAPFPDAVLASTAIPGVFPPVRIGDRHYVDGGAVTATSLDLAVAHGCEAILCIAPLGYRKEGALLLPDPKMWGPMAVRYLFARSLRREVVDARGRGVEVLVVRPWIAELKAQGTNSMRLYDRTAVSEAAREGTLRLLEDKLEHPALALRTGGKARGTG